MKKSNCFDEYEEKEIEEAIEKASQYFGRYPEHFGFDLVEWFLRNSKKKESNKEKRTMTQCEKILKYIDKHGSITTWDAFRDLGITRLSGRIHDLTQKGYDFERKTETAKNRDGEPVTYTRYSFMKKEREE